ncbi:hypothetical protein OH76DRAFT_831179 [Lentinus brumalis]|uniref:Uncharacterized protein n=1 Tax=Lentinus brumalis TaxID=2498619 RepID=A0A371D1X2_9APHY|nr:hypothetical protein OH76DRAFT_831179 [Polyporus brumalis]
MMVPFRYVLAIALLHLTATVCAAPASSPESSASNTVSPLTKDAGAHIGTGANIPSEGKQVLKDVDDVHQRRRGIAGPVSVGQGNADDSHPPVPVQNYKNDVARLPVFENIQAPESQGGVE